MSTPLMWLLLELLGLPGGLIACKELFTTYQKRGLWHIGTWPARWRLWFNSFSQGPFHRGSGSIEPWHNTYRMLTHMLWKYPQPVLGWADSLPYTDMSAPNTAACFLIALRHLGHEVSLYLVSVPGGAFGALVIVSKWVTWQHRWALRKDVMQSENSHALGFCLYKCLGVKIIETGSRIMAFGATGRWQWRVAL